MYTLEEIKKALEQDQFIFYYQPKISMLTGKICGVEALIRWQKTPNQLISPDLFIPVAEETGFINKITCHMFDKLIIDLNIINDIQDGLKVSLNVSPKDFENNKFINKLKMSLENKLFDPKNIELELTEASRLSEHSLILEQFSLLEHLGVEVAMDDFGTGFSSIDLLSKIEFSAIKLDQGIVGRMGYSKKDKALVDASIRMGHRLGLDIIAEGIEDEESYRTLQKGGCTIAQGYWMSKPLSFSDTISIIRAKKQWPATPSGLLYMAQLDHLRWRKDLVDGALSIFDSDNSNKLLSNCPPLDHKSCMLGKWYYSEAKCYESSEAFNDLEEPHKMFHQIGSGIRDLVEKGGDKEEILKQVRILNRHSAEVILLLQEIEHELA